MNHFGSHKDMRTTRPKIYQIFKNYLSDSRTIKAYLTLLVITSLLHFFTNQMSQFEFRLYQLVSVFYCLDFFTLYLKNLKQTHHIQTRLGIRKTKVKVLRSSRHILISKSNLLVGDILTFEPGDLIEVDGIITNLCCESFVRVNYLSETYHKFSCFQKNQDCFLFAGSFILQGKGEILVCAVGDNLSSMKQIIMINQLPMQS